MTGRGFQYGVAAVGLAGTLALGAVILASTGGVLIYTLDDPYIHLALAEEILRGNYGISPGAFASPSSSMLYAPLLAVMLAAGLGTLAPLMLAMAGQGMTLWLIAGAMAPSIRSLGVAIVVAPVLVLAVNGFALPLTGMEHPLHAAASVAVIVGLARATRGALPGWLVPVIVLLPALRFEGYALALAAVVALAALGHRRVALLALAGIVGLTLAYAAAMLAMGLPILPSSVLVKSALSAAAVEAEGRDALIALIVNLLRGAATWPGALMALAGVALLVHSLREPSVRGFVWPALAAVLAHLIAGRFGWFGRYEVYAVALLLTTVALAFRGRVWPMLGLCALFGAGYVGVTQRTPEAALAIHQQQHQMHRFATEYFPHPVAVNDLGWVAWRNETPVIDLWGLGSEEARRLTAREGRSIATVRALTEGRAAFAMVYDIAFAGAIPPEWCRIAVLSTLQGVLPSGDVAIYRIDRSLAVEMDRALRAFATTLPPGATLHIEDCPA